MRVVEDRAVSRQPWFWVAVAGGVLLLVLMTAWAINARNADPDHTVRRPDVRRKHA
jgi:hypothetical protein